MSLEFINKLQVKLYNILAEVPIIKDKIKKIYVSVKQDGEFPFIFLNICRLKDASLFDHKIYEVDFAVSLYLKDNSSFAMEVISQIKAALTKESCSFDKHIIAAMQSEDLKFDLAADLVTNKITISYKTLIQEQRIL